MALTKDFRETIRERAQREPKFRQALLREAIELMLSGDEKTGRAILRNYINATVGFRQLEEATSIPANSLMRMFGPNGNPSAKNLFGVLAHRALRSSRQTRKLQPSRQCLHGLGVARTTFRRPSSAISLNMAPLRRPDSGILAFKLP
jgi:DNA-binding phage protein